MSTVPGSAGIPGLDPTVPSPAPRYQRHALGLPAGSVRALLALMVLAALWLLAVYGDWSTDEKGALSGPVPLTFVYLQYVMILILAHFFASHGSTIGRHVSARSPLGLPAGTIRFLLLAGYLGLIVWFLRNRREFEALPTGNLLLPLVLMSGFIVGFIITKLVRAASGGQIPFWFQDVQAWAALIAMLGLTIIIIVYLFIFPSIAQELRFNMTTIETGVAAMVGFYFGARS
jgi:hypothetical protein